MRIKTIVIILVSLMLLITILENTGTVPFKIVFINFNISKLLLILVLTAIGFVLGYLVGRPKKVRYISGADPAQDQVKEAPDTRSIKDEDYID